MEASQELPWVNSVGCHRIAIKPSETPRNPSTIKNITINVKPWIVVNGNFHIIRPQKSQTPHLYQHNQHPNSLSSPTEFLIFLIFSYLGMFPWETRPGDLPSSPRSEVRELTVGSQAHDNSSSRFWLGPVGLHRSFHRWILLHLINPAKLGNMRCMIE